MKKYTTNDLYYGFVEKWNNNNKKIYKTILLQLNNNTFYDFKYKIIIKNDPLNTYKKNNVLIIEKCSDLKRIKKYKYKNKIKKLEL